MERLSSTVFYFLSYFGWSVNYMSQVSKFHKFKFHKLRQGVYLKAFSIVIYGQFNSIFAVYFLSFFIWSVNCLCHFFSSFLLMNKFYESSPQTKEHISEMSRNVSINLYLRPFCTAIYRRFYLCFTRFQIFSGL